MSPFYVVHYGIIYSDTFNSHNERVGYHWRKDPSVELWNVRPSAAKGEFFKNAADWVVDKIETSGGQSHLIYDFNWAYRNYPGGGLVAPWWSGLTDGYAIILLLRAYDVYGDDKYIVAASKLYQSVLAPIKSGGSLSELNGLPWIEEYVAPRENPAEMSKVLNGMVYAYFGIRSFEEHPGGFGHSEMALNNSIRRNFKSFSMSYWSLYDSIGNGANIKYHRIHVALLAGFAKNDSELVDLLRKWSAGAKFPGLFWVLNSGWSFSKVHFLALWFAVCFAGLIGLNKLAKRSRPS
jgi:hypothetical protein